MREKVTDDLPISTATIAPLSWEAYGMFFRHTFGCISPLAIRSS